MSTEHLNARQIEEFNKGTASPAELLTMLDHFSHCESCRKQALPEQKLRVVVDSLRRDFGARTHESHLTYSELAGHVDETLAEPDREIVESHLNLCSQCSAEAADLRAFRAEMTTYPEIERRPARMLTLRERVASLWRPSGYRIPIQLAAAATLAIVCITVAKLLLRQESSPAPAEVAQVQPDSQGQDTSGAKPESQAEAQHAPEQNALAEASDAIHDGSNLIALDKQGNITGLESLPEAYRQEVKTALTGRRVNPPPDLESLIGRTGVLMGGTGEATGFKVIGPIGTVVRSDKPTFRWQRLSGATSYTVAVFDSDFNKVASSEPLPGTEWSPAARLQRGRLYSWQVTAIRQDKELVSPAPPAPDAKFKILDDSKTKELEQARRTYAGSHLMLGILYERAGLLDDAEREFKSLYAANPKSQIVRKLLGDVRSLRRPR